MKYSNKGLLMTEAFERLVLFAYPDPASAMARELQRRGLWEGVLKGNPIPDELSNLSADPWTMGYGDRHGVKLGDTTTREAAEQRLLQNIAHCEANVNSHCATIITQGRMTQGMFDSLVDFDFNTGKLDTSTLLRLVNSGDLTAAAKEFEKWDHAGGKVVAGLLRRRQAEEAEFSQGASANA